jgi:hypothetical protein
MDCSSSTSKSVQDDIRFKQGKKMVAENNFDAAIEFFSELLEARYNIERI